MDACPAGGNHMQWQARRALEHGSHSNSQRLTCRPACRPSRACSDSAKPSSRRPSASRRSAAAASSARAASLIEARSACKGKHRQLVTKLVNGRV